MDEIAENIIEQGVLWYIMVKRTTTQGGIVGQVLFVMEDAHLRNRQPTILFAMDTILYSDNNNNNKRTITMTTITIKQQ